MKKWCVGCPSNGLYPDSDRSLKHPDSATGYNNHNSNSATSCFWELSSCKTQHHLWIVTTLHCFSDSVSQHYYSGAIVNISVTWNCATLNWLNSELWVHLLLIWWTDVKTGRISGMYHLAFTWLGHVHTAVLTARQALHCSCLTCI